MLEIDLDESWDVREERGLLIVEGFSLAKSEFRCRNCHSTRVTVDYADQQRVSGVDAISLDATCRECGETALHIAY